MALTQQQRDERRREKAERLQEEDLRLKVRPGTKQALLELMEWAGIEEQGEAMTLMIHRLHGRNQESKATSRHDGKANTDALIAEGSHPAAEAARAYQADGHSDFDLPAASQLYQAWVHGLITEGAYWSSSQRSATSAFTMTFDVGFQSYDGKLSELRVRPVRRFFI
ncbi:hypothetical protein [Pseudomonas sichuanensis]|uniref:hypothetical protein n=1 Tax=Pseudomonas TaxID=286 RepID=UPI0036ED96F3